MNITKFWSAPGRFSFAQVAVSGILFSLSLVFVNHVISWIALLPLFLILSKAVNIRQAVQIGLLFGCASAGILNYWMVPAIQYYAQGSLFLAVACWLLAVLLIALCYALQFVLFVKLSFRSDGWPALVLSALLMAVLWVGGEWLRAQAFSGMPWLSYSFGVSLSSQLYLVQPAAIGSVYILSFSLVLFNYSLSHAVHSRSWKWALAPLLIVLVHAVSGLLMYGIISDKLSGDGRKHINTSLVLASQSPEAVWDERNGSALVQNLLSLNRQAVTSSPELVLWSETVVPWTYSPDDDFLREISRGVAGRGAHYLMGMSSPVSHNSSMVYNSAYLFKPDGQVVGRYDKTALLTLVERPLFEESSGIILPFLAGGGLAVRAGSVEQLMQTPWGKAGLLLCSESAVPTLTNSYGKLGATFLINLGNDGWFSDYFITRQHFYNCRLRAVETRKDIVINNNRGVSGVIHGTGDIGARFQSDEASIQQVSVYPNSVPANDFHLFLYALFLLGAALAIGKCFERAGAKSERRPNVS
ncbi:apolipoprotein N-acyltransferase [Pontibacter sp. H249]|uniref:apolipoprotein N-acyltransferase n=1 Tax=Pontibacter sp. H249 TaxID=3133420 RepID=UPI0030BCD276